MNLLPKHPLLRHRLWISYRSLPAAPRGLEVVSVQEGEGCSQSIDLPSCCQRERGKREVGGGGRVARSRGGNSADEHHPKGERCHEVAWSWAGATTTEAATAIAAGASAGASAGGGANRAGAGVVPAIPAAAEATTCAVVGAAVHVFMGT